MPNLLHMYLGIAPEGPVQARAQMDAVRAAGFTHARFIASGYWPVDMTRANGWRTNPTAYWQAVDQLMADARARQLRLVPSLLWQAWLFPDLNNAPLSALFTPGTPTRTMADQYVREFVQRYATDPAVVVWEIGNEWNLLADLDHSVCTVCAGTTPNGCGALAPSLGTPCRRTTADNFFSCNSCRSVSTATQDLGQWAAAMAQLIKQHDTLQRPVSTGHAYPRASAYHLARSPCPACDWTADSESEFTVTLAQLHPAPIDFISVHAYPGDDARRFGDLDSSGFSLLQRTKSATTSLGKRLYVGEYGEPRPGSITCNGISQCGGDANAASTKLVALGLVQFDVDLSALWAWDFHQFCAATPTCYGVESGEPLAGFLSVAERAAGQCRGQLDQAPCATGRCLSQTCRPVDEGGFDLEASGSETSWLSWTNCSSCTPSTFQRVAVGSRFGVRLATNDLPCSGSCQFPGGYALSPSVNLTPGHRQVLVRADVSSSVPGAALRLIGFDSADAEVSSSDFSIPATSLATQSAVLSVPATVTHVRLRLEQPNPNAQLVVDAVRIGSLP